MQDTAASHSPSGERIVIGVIAIAWALFQLALPSVLLIDSTIARSIHLAFALGLLYLEKPALKRKRHDIDSRPRRIQVAGYALSVIAVLSALYLVFQYDALAARAGAPIVRDMIAAGVLVVLVLEAARRSVGPAISVIAVMISLYAFMGPHMPDFLAFKGVSLRKYLSNISLSTEGIFGIPLSVSTSIVFLFVLLGSLLERSGAGVFFTNLALSLLGRYKGGAAKAAVVASGATGMVSGSSIANIVTTGPFTIPLMKKVGYPAKKAAAVEVAASTDGQLMPPIMGAAAFIIAEYVNIPYLQVVRAAAIPAITSYFGLFCITHLEAGKLGIRGLSKEDLPDFLKTLLGGVHHLIPLVVLVYELVVLRHSPELGAFRSIMALVGVLTVQEAVRGWRAGDGVIEGIKRAIRLMAEGMIQGSRNMVAVAMACAAAGIIVGVVNMGIGGMIAQIVEAVSMGNLYLLLLITAVASLLLGMGLPTTATYIVMASLTAPVIVKVGALYGFAIPVLSAHLFCFYFGILADDTPPVGLASYAASAIAGSNPIETGLQGFLYDIRTSIIAFLFVLNPELILYGINSWPHGLMIFAMSLVGISAFECAVQGWCLTRNKWYEAPLLVLAAMMMFHPGAFASLVPIGLSSKYVMYAPAAAIYLGVVLLQQRRLMKRVS